MAKCSKKGCPGKAKCSKCSHGKKKAATKVTVKGKAPKKAAKAPRKRGY